MCGRSVYDESYSQMIGLNVEKSPKPAAKISQEVNKMSKPKNFFYLCQVWISANCTRFHFYHVTEVSTSLHFQLDRFSEISAIIFFPHFCNNSFYAVWLAKKMEGEWLAFIVDPTHFRDRRQRDGIYRPKTSFPSQYR